MVSTFEYDASCRLRRARNSDRGLVFERDRVGRIIGETVNGRQMRYGYDARGRRVSRGAPSGAESRWVYDDGSRPVALHAAGHTIRLGYDAAGREAERHLNDQVSLNQTWDPRHRVRAQDRRERARGNPKAAAAVAVFLRRSVGRAGG